MSLGEIQSTATAIDPWSIVAVICLIVIVVIGFDKFHDAGMNLKDKLLNRKFNKMVEKAEKGDTTLREEFRIMFNEAHEEHEEINSRLDHHDRCLAHDKRTIERMQGEIEQLDVRVTARTEEGTLMIKTAKVILNNQLGLADTTSVVDIVEEIDKFLIEGRDK